MSWWPPAGSPAAQSIRLEALAHQLLQRYSLVMRRILERERGLPPWRDLLRAYWRLEAWGEVRGGRFVTGFSGEQFAHPEAVAALRRHREPGVPNPRSSSAPRTRSTSPASSPPASASLPRSATGFCTAKASR